MIVYCCENWGIDLEEICYVIVDIVCVYLDMLVLFLVYFNLVVCGLVYVIFGSLLNVMLIVLLDYLVM